MKNRHFDFIFVWAPQNRVQKKKTGIKSWKSLENPNWEIKTIMTIIEMIQSLETIAEIGEEIRDFVQEVLPSDDHTIFSSFLT